MGELALLIQQSPAASLILAAMVIASWIGWRSPQLIESNLFRPYWLARRGEWHTLITNGFLHADLFHLFFNGFTFWAFAFTLERTIGSAAFLALYVFGLLVSDFGTWMSHHKDPSYRCLGASGAILAVLFASILYHPLSKMMILPIPVPIPAWLFAIAYPVYSWVASRQGRSGVAHDAHLAGALAGLAFVAVTDLPTFTRALQAWTGAS